MKIVIDIDEEYYSYLRRVVFTDRIFYRPVAIIAKGKPLPKGHGRLIEQPTNADIAETIGGQNAFADCIRETVATVFENAETVIEADGGDAE